MAKIGKIIVFFVAVFVLLRGISTYTVQVGNVGVRVSNFSGVDTADLKPGWRMEIPGVHKIWEMPGHYQYLNFTGEEALEIRTKDNNIVKLDISVPYRIVPGDAHLVVSAGNHLPDGGGGFRYQRLMRETTISVLRAKLADLKSSDFYDTNRRMEVAEDATVTLTAELGPLHLEAENVLLRASYFRAEYELQLSSIQLNEQSKLLDGARERVADRQQKLDNYVQATAAQAASLEQNWAKRIADMDRAYQVGFVKQEENGVGAARIFLDAMEEAPRGEIVVVAAKTFSLEPPAITDGHLLGIKTVQAETLEYDQRVKAEADGVSGRLAAEGAAKVAEVRGEFEARVNALLNSPAGRAYVAYVAAENIQFAETLTFQSGEGIPSVLRLREFARAFMGG